MKKLGEIIPEIFRNDGSSAGLQYVYIYGHDFDAWYIWHRVTGAIIHVNEIKIGENLQVAEHEIRKKCYLFNNLDYNKDTDTEAIDQTP